MFKKSCGNRPAAGAGWPYFLLLAALVPSTGMAQIPSGPHPVGFQSQRVDDYSRPAVAGDPGSPRSVQIDIWYPAQPSGEPMTVADYWRHSYAGPATMRSADLAKVPVRARSGAKPEESIAGVILYSPGIGGEGFDNFLICEALAGQGYLVASAPSLGFLTRKAQPVPQDLEVAARDLEFVADVVRRTWPGAKSSKFAVMGYSWGGLAAMLIQMRNPGVTAVVNIDSAIASHEDKAAKTAWFNLQAMRVPSLYFSAADTLEMHNRLLERIHYSATTHIPFAGVNHGDFQSISYLRSLSPKPDAHSDAAKSAYERVTAATVSFFNLWLKGQQPAPDAVKINTKPSLPPPPTEAEFFAMIRKDGPEKALKLFKEFRQRDPGVNFFGEMAIAELGFSLFDGGRKREGIEALELAFLGYPKSYRPHGYVGSLLEDTGERDRAIAEYGIALGMAMKDTDSDPLQTAADVKLFEGLIAKLSKKSPAK
ncbi:MAG: hypothetical protein ABI823_19400 [Bryobacteraceae bacterium]